MDGAAPVAGLLQGLREDTRGGLPTIDGRGVGARCEDSAVEAILLLLVLLPEEDAIES